MNAPRTVLVIGGSDSSAGAGIQADLKTVERCGAYCLTALTAVTAQGPSRVRGIYPLPPRAVAAQIRAVLDDFRVDAVKTGMLWSAPIVRAVARGIARSGARSVVVDPVLATHGGSGLSASGLREALLALLFPVASIVTPNIPEAEALAGMRIRGVDDIREAARRLLARGAKAVLIKGGHGTGCDAVDWYHDGRSLRGLKSRRLGGPSFHGSGCILASAIAAAAAQGASISEAVLAGRAYARRVRRRAWIVPAGRRIAVHR